MSSKNCASTKTSMTPNSFWISVDILLKKPHVVNKRLWGSKIIYRIICTPPTSNWTPPLGCKRIEDINEIENYKTKLLKEFNIAESKEENPSNVEIILTELLPKNYNECHAYQLILLRKENLSATFYDVTPEDANQNICPVFSYILQLDNDTVVLSSECNTSKSYQWLKDIVLSQFVKWGEECAEQQQTICNESLALVSSVKYYQKYNDLKLKYGNEMVKKWPECTDPQKFVYEDVAIATYLLLIWEDERQHLDLKTPQRFVDLGCGNGLLVYILTQEGHPGVGIDVTKRKIWDIYPADVNLEEKTITPSDINIFPESDWVIGNHSDELTPWIPVIAARSSYKCNFFLLPCCAFNFDGTKYRRQNSSISQYTEYLQYIKQLCEGCGFITDIDRLKIPSTKRICLVSKGRTYPKQEFDKYCEKIQNIINNGASMPPDATQNLKRSWINGFKAREPVQKVRNCTQIDKSLIDSIVDKISSYLLQGVNLESNWSIGKSAELNEVVQLIPQDQLKSLKSECGGLQTLLKNNHHIFKVQGGIVQLRFPKTVKEVNKNMESNKSKAHSIKVQQKPCWFHNNHPQGCPLTDKNCSFLHVRK